VSAAAQTGGLKSLKNLILPDGKPVMLLRKVSLTAAI